MRQAYQQKRTELARGVRHGRRPLATPPWRPLSFPPDVERRQFVSRANTSRLRSALMTLSGAESLDTAAPVLAPIIEHRTHTLRSNCARRGAQKWVQVAPAPSEVRPAPLRTSCGAAGCQTTYLSSIGTVFVMRFHTNSITAPPRALRNQNRSGNQTQASAASARN